MISSDNHFNGEKMHALFAASPAESVYHVHHTERQQHQSSSQPGPGECDLNARDIWSH